MYAFYTGILLHITVCICEVNIFSDICEHPWNDFKRVSECGVCRSKWMADCLQKKKKKKKPWPGVLKKKGTLFIIFTQTTTDTVNALLLNVCRNRSNFPPSHLGAAIKMFEYVYKLQAAGSPWILKDPDTKGNCFSKIVSVGATAITVALQLCRHSFWSWQSYVQTPPDLPMAKMQLRYEIARVRKEKKKNQLGIGSDKLERKVNQEAGLQCYRERRS